MVQIAIGRRSELQRAETDIVERFVIDAERFVGVFHQLMNGQGGIVRLDDSVRNLFGAIGTDDTTEIHERRQMKVEKEVSRRFKINEQKHIVQLDEDGSKGCDEIMKFVKFRCAIQFENLPLAKEQRRMCS